LSLGAVFSKKNGVSFITTLTCMWVAVFLLSVALRAAGRHVNPLMPHLLVLGLTALAACLWDIYSPISDPPGPSSLLAQLRRVNSLKTFCLFALHNAIGAAILAPMAFILAS
jgi:hypothetical protein